LIGMNSQTPDLIIVTLDTDRQTNRETDRQTDRQTDIVSYRIGSESAVDCSPHNTGVWPIE